MELELVELDFFVWGWMSRLVLDLQRLINMILRRPEADAYSQEWWARGDINTDGQWSVLDLQGLIIIILEKPTVAYPAAGANRADLPQVGNVLMVDTGGERKGEAGVMSVNLNNQDAVTSGEFKFTYNPNIGLNITGVRVATRLQNFQVAFLQKLITPDLAEVHILFYNLSGINLLPGDGTILFLDYSLIPAASGSTPVRFTNAVLADQTGAALPVSTSDTVYSIYKRLFLPTLINR